jgi:hypothetical protein
MDVAAGLANTKVLLHPNASRTVVHASNTVATAVVDFHGRLGIGSGRESVEARRWLDAATEVRDKVLKTGADGVDVAKRRGSETFSRAKSATGRLSGGIAERALRLRGGDDAS